jgi:cyclopropane-fatty-acyl-phospholipid synthase
MTAVPSVAGVVKEPPRRFQAVARFLKENWSAGALTFALPDGREVNLRGAEPGVAGRLQVRDYGFIDRVFSRGLVGFGEGFMAGEWDTPDLSALLQSFGRNLDGLSKVIAGNALVRWLITAGHALRANTREGARRNIEAHYDLGNDFYSLWLDPTMTYSSARFDAGANSLAAAQTAKYAALARLIDLKPGHHVLEIGCGWGGFAEYAAREVGAKVTGITISPAQLAFARERMARQGLNDRVELKLVDYRDVEGSFDRIASIEMFEAVGQRYWPAYFSTLRDRLKPGGLAGLQIITIRDDLFHTYRRNADFIQKYIFPGGMLPTPDRLSRQIGKAGLALKEVEHFSEDYARTLHQWRERFDAREDEVAALGFDQRFIRMWRFYLAYCEAGFSTRRTEVGQWVCARS